MAYIGLSLKLCKYSPVMYREAGNPRIAPERDLCPQQRPSAEEKLSSFGKSELDHWERRDTAVMSRTLG